MSQANTGFSSEQQEYLKGFFSGVQQRAQSPFLGKTADGLYTGDANQAVDDSVFGTPVDDLCKEELIKHEQNGLDVWDTIVANADKDVFPEAPDMFRYKFYGLFHVKPAQDSFMLRCRIAGGALRSWQFAGLADIAEDWGGGYADLTTRANVQVREIMPANTIKVLMKLTDLGLTSKGSGADNLRNITATPTTGFDDQECLDVMPYARAMHHYILNNRDMYGLPRKFNISFDSGGKLSVCADTNDIGFYAVRVGEGHDVPAGVYFRVQLCGITGHKQFATDSGILVEPEDAVAVAAAIVRVFIENGDRTNRKKARLKYLVDDWGIPKFLEETDKKLAKKLVYFDLDKCESRPVILQHGHIGIHNQKQEGLNYLGVVIPVGRMSPEQMRGIAELSERYGQGEIRLTVWQNLLIPHVKDEDLDALKQAVIDLGFHYTTTMVSGGLIACTGNTGCKFAASNTKGQAVELSDYLTKHVTLDLPINIHLTGCPHSCAQHYIGDIGLQGAKCKVGDDTVEGYHIVLGGGVDDRQAIAKEIAQSVPFEEIKPMLARGLLGYLDQREEDESFWQFTQRHDEAALQALFHRENELAAN